MFFHLFLLYRLLSFSFLPRAFLRAVVVSRKEKGESEGEEKNSQIILRSRSAMSDWRSSTVRESVLKAFVAKGFLPSKEVVHWRVPRREEFPQPRPNEVVSFLTFHEHGLGYPVHWFLCGLLNEWGLELQHLNPTGVLHIIGFVTVYEAFLGMEPHVDLFR